MINSGGKENKNLAKTLYTKYKQPTVKTWIQKLATSHILQQTTPDWGIHTNDQQNENTLPNTWENKWEQHKKLHQNWETRGRKDTHTHTTSRNTNTRTKHQAKRKTT